MKACRDSGNRYWRERREVGCEEARVAGGLVSVKPGCLLTSAPLSL